MAFSIGTNQVYGQGVITPRDNVEESEDQDIEEETDTDEGDSGDDSADLPVPVLFGVPVEGIYDSYGDPRGGGERKHKGLDMMAPVGTPIVSPTDAEVKRIGTWSGAGHFVITEADGKKFRYYHLQEPAEHLEEGDDIDTGNLIGFVGTSGNATEDAPHLHLEIREDGEPRNPYPRVTKNFSLDETMRLLEGVLADAESDDELAAFLADAFADTFARARRQETAVPDPVLADLPENFAELPPLPQQNLTVGDRGDGVRTLQHILINRDYLDINSPTSYFGSLTKTALADYQEDSGIAPASGYYGPITRSRLQGARTKSDTNSQTNQQLTERISQLQKRVKQLQNKL
jgi:hypothetical protein